MRNDRDLLQTAKRGQGIEKTVQSAIDRDSLQMETLAVGADPGPASLAERAEQSLLLAAALEKLPDDYRIVLTLRHIDGKSHEEIAQQIGRSPAATRMLWVRALEALKREFG